MKTSELPEETIELILKLDKTGLRPLEIAQELNLNFQLVTYVVYNYEL